MGSASIPSSSAASSSRLPARPRHSVSAPPLAAARQNDHGDARVRVARHVRRHAVFGPATMDRARLVPGVHGRTRGARAHGCSQSQGLRRHVKQQPAPLVQHVRLHDPLDCVFAVGHLRDCDGSLLRRRLRQPGLVLGVRHDFCLHRLLCVRSVGFCAESPVHQSPRHCGAPRRDPYLLHLSADQDRGCAAALSRTHLRVALGVHAPAQAHVHEWVLTAELPFLPARVEPAVGHVPRCTRRAARGGHGAHVPGPVTVLADTLLQHGVRRDGVHRRAQRTALLPSERRVPQRQTRRRRSQSRRQQAVVELAH